MTDDELRKQWAKGAAVQHMWPDGGLPEMEDRGNGMRFVTGWHESEYQVFKLGYLLGSMPKKMVIEETK
jgi:hypothetical protein